MTNGTAAAVMIADSILGRRTPGSSCSTPSGSLRGPRSTKVVKENASAGFHFFADRVEPATRPPLTSFGPGEGAIVGRVRKTAVYRDDDGTVHELSPVCRHLWCIVDWNPAERTWDCPCHGSRYAADGRVLEARPPKT